MFRTTAWTMIGNAGAGDAKALETFGERYRPAVVAYLRSRGLPEAEADDACQDAFLRVLSGGVLRRADRARGRFRSLLLSVVVHVLQDRARKRREVAMPEGVEPVFTERDDDFDRAWVLHLAERAMQRLQADESPYYDVLKGHLAGQPQDRNKVWIARKKLIALIRDEIAFTCLSQREFDEEVAHLGPFLRPRKKAETKA
jgi:sigma-70-like protein